LRTADPRTDWEALFLSRAQRRVRLDATFSLEGHLWEAPVHLRGQLIQVRFNPFEWRRVEIWRDDKYVGPARRCDNNSTPKPIPTAIMTAPINPLDLDTALKSLWGASQLPFGAAVEKPYASDTFKETRHRLEQLVAVRACGLLHRSHGVGKTLLVQHFLQSLPDKRYKNVGPLPFPRVTGTDLIRLLCAELGQTARMRRSDNVLLIRQGCNSWNGFGRWWSLTKRKISAPPRWRKCAC